MLGGCGKVTRKMVSVVSEFVMTSQTPSTPRATRLIVADIDGCLSRGSRSHFSRKLIDKLVATNHASRIDPLVPAVTLCTGRPQPYVECLLQVIHSDTPALCEGGTVMFHPKKHLVEFHKDFGVRENELLDRLRVRVDEVLLRPGVVHEPGKATHVTLLVTDPWKPTDLMEQAEAVRAEFGGTFTLDYSRIAMHFLFRHLNKGSGITWLAQRTGVALDEMAAIGDATPDLHFMRRTGLSCAPANAFDPVKEIATHVSKLEDAEAVMEFIDMVLQRNRDLATAAATTSGVKAR